MRIKYFAIVSFGAYSSENTKRNRYKGNMAFVENIFTLKNFKAKTTKHNH